MNWIDGLQRSLDYIEAHLTEEIDYEQIAAQAYSSSFHFQRIFSLLCGLTIGEYIRGRRLSLAGEELSDGSFRVIDTALKYGYDNPESFSRAFKQFHGITPSQAKQGHANLKTLSRLSLKLVVQGGITMHYRIETTQTLPILVKKARFASTAEIDPKAIHRFWQEAAQDGTLDTLCQALPAGGPLHQALLGVCLDNPLAGDFDYAIGAVCPAGTDAAGLALETLPAATWAVFPCVGAMPEAFNQLYQKIYTEFFPTSHYQPTGPYLEVYPSANTSSPDYYCEIWLAVTAENN